jgi:hypothetical protein
MMMSTTAQSTAASLGYWSDLEYLLLGDLRQVLDEPATLLRDRWLVSLLDVLLAGHSRDLCGSVAKVDHRMSVCVISAPMQPLDYRNEFLAGEREMLYGKLQRLRDRVAHRTPSSLLSNEIRCDLQDLIPLC